MAAFPARGFGRIDSRKRAGMEETALAMRELNLYSVQEDIEVSFKKCRMIAPVPFSLCALPLLHHVTSSADKPNVLAIAVTLAVTTARSTRTHPLRQEQDAERA